jgi:N-acyl-D-aspartate/D-glutamate deacylase
MPVFHSGTALSDEDAWPLPAGALTHPRTAGTFARTLRTYVRENRDMELVEAIRRSATLPAQMLEPFTPAMRRKGRLQVGADADVIAFDPERISDQATYERSCRPSTGFRHVLVNGVPVIEDGLLDRSAMPGRPIRA